MAGPAAAVLVNFAGQRYVPNWREILGRFASSWHEPNLCYVSDTQRFGGVYLGEARPFVGSVEELGEYGDPEAQREAIAAVSGRAFTHSIVIAAMRKDAVDHRILCELCIAIAESHEGLVDLGPLTAPFDELGLQQCIWQDVDAEYTTVLGTVAAARRWLAHDSFYMVK
ncbi:DUF6368 family protein [Anatilimnocola floriformis]|uniref:DUF6368 family protein n=1 Tax=Anatilimnocola floriformis TaxID=2948575 RepID=UPI0020C50CAF|nr:DUF6368 family protein [Anatilimnocola floriformis]